MSWRDWVLDGLFPPTCFGCQADGAWLCEECFSSIELRNRASCPQCGKYPWESHLCVGDWEFTSFLSMSAYGNPVLQTLLTSYKYKRARCLEPVFQRLLQTYKTKFKEQFPWGETASCLVTSLPMDATRQRTRGLDHASLFADVVASELVPGAIRAPLLKRKREALPNASLHDPQLRAANIHELFECIQPTTHPVILVDDVCTTGATAREAARVLLQAGVPEVHLFTLASGVAATSSSESLK